MYSLCRRGMNPNRASIEAIDNETFIAKILDGEVAIFKNGKVISSCDSTEYSIETIVKSRADLEAGFANTIGLNIISGEVTVQRYGLNTNTVHKTRLEGYAGLGFDGYNDNSISHLHVAPSPAAGLNVMLPANASTPRYSVYKINPLGGVSLLQGAIGHGTIPAATKHACLMPIDKYCSIFISADDMLYTRFGLQCYFLHKDIGWLSQYNRLGDFRIEYLGEGLTLALDKSSRVNDTIFVCLPTEGRSLAITKYISGITLNGNLSTYKTASKTCIIVTNRAFLSPLTCVTTCPVTGKVIVWDGATSNFYRLTYFDQLEKINFNRMPKQTFINVYKYLIKKCGALTPSNKKETFEVKLSPPILDYIKDKIGSKITGEKVNIEINNIDSKDGEVNVKLYTSDKQIHTFTVSKDLWEKAFIYKNKRSYIDTETPVFRLLRMAKGTKFEQVVKEGLYKKHI